MTIISILNNLFKIIIMLVSIVIYQQVQILTSGLIFSKCPKIHILLKFVQFFSTEYITQITQTYVSRMSAVCQQYVSM